MAVLEVKNLSKCFGKVNAVDDISFSVEKGEIFGFLGPNGAGKTTTIRCIMDFLRPSLGNINVFGLDSLKNSSEIKKRVGYLPADVSLYDGWTGQDHFNFLEKVKGKSENLSELIEKFDYNPKIKFKNLSTGNKRKLGIIIALMHKPELIILDEPTAGLDPLLQNTTYEILQDYQKTGSTIFMSSHNLAEVDRICSKVVIIKDGKIVATEGVSDLKNKKIHVVTVHFNGPFEPNNLLFEGAEVQEKLPDGLILDVKGDLNPLVKKLGAYDIRDLEISHASLEEVFLEFYNKAKPSQTAARSFDQGEKI